MKIYLEDNLPNKRIAYYALQLIAFNKNFSFIYAESKEAADVTVGMLQDATIRVCENFYKLIKDKRTNYTYHLNQSSKTVQLEDGTTDYLSTIFYYVNCVQEFYSKDFDGYGRFKYSESVQHNLGLIKENFVQQLIDEFCERNQFLSKLKATSRKSGFFLTHDIDDVFKAKNEDGKYALTKGKWLHIPRLLWNHYAGTPDLLNMETIVETERKYGFSSSFFWLVVKSKINADYNFKSQLIQEQYELVKNSGSTNGVHKAWAESSFQEEMNLFPEKVIANRYHFLKFTVHDFSTVEQAGIKLDTSLGFAEHFGFRNNYGLPYMPFDLEDNRVLNLLEVPMQVMDRTFFNLKQKPEKAKEEVVEWMRKQTDNCIFTINWHNNFFTDLKYKGYRKFYDDLLNYFHQNNLHCYSQDELLKEFFRPDFFTLPDNLK